MEKSRTVQSNYNEDARSPPFEAAPSKTAFFKEDAFMAVHVLHMLPYGFADYSILLN
jgi:hypothetical protein